MSSANAVVLLRPGDDLDRALKKFKDACAEAEVPRELKKRDHYVKPGEARRLKSRLAQIVDGFPKTVVLTEDEIRDALHDSVMTIVETVRTCLEQTPPELAADIVDTGIVITGGGGLLRGLDRLLGKETQLPVRVAQDPMSCVALGLGRVLDELELLKKVAMPA